MPQQDETRRYTAEVIEVRSGDDLTLMVDLGIDGLHKKVRARLQGVDTPDAYQATNGSEAGKVRNDVRVLTRNKTCTIDVHSAHKNGWIITLYIDDHSSNPPVCLNKALIEKGYVYKGQP